MNKHWHSRKDAHPSSKKKIKLIVGMLKGSGKWVLVHKNLFPEKQKDVCSIILAMKPPLWAVTHKRS